MQKFYLIIAFFYFTAARAQQPVITLSEQYLAKIEKTKSIDKKLKRYRHYLHKDSVRFIKKLERYWQAQTDSIHSALVGKEIKAKEKISKLREELYGKIPSGGEGKVAEQLGKVGDMPSVENIDVPNVSDLNVNESATNVTGELREKIPSVEMPKEGTEAMNEIKEYTGQLKTYQGYAEGLGNRDSLKSMATQKAKAYGTEAASKVAGHEEFNSLKGQVGEANQLKTLVAGYGGDMKQYTDSAYVKEQARKKAEELAMQYLQDNPEIMQGVKAKMSVLMKKYSVVPNSNDLSSAIKRTSLKGKAFRERLVIATNFQIINLDPLSIDFSPTIGYKVNTNFQLGVGGTYRQQFSADTIPTIAPDVLGYKAFASYNVLANLFLYTEFDRNTSGIKKTDNSSTRIWSQALMAGVGRKITVHKKIDMTVIMLYDFMHKKNDPVNPQPWIVRIGFQTSELAMMKRRLQ